MAKIAEIKKLIETKTKSYANAEDSVKKEQGIITAMEKQVALLKKTKAPRDTIKQAEKEIETSEKKVGQIQKGMEENMKAIEALNERLVLTTEFAESREGFLKWWEKEEAKMADLVDKIRDEASEAESQSVAAEKAVSSGDVAGARKAAGLARAAADKAGTLTDQVHKTNSGWGPTKDVQRNYKTSDMDKGDVDSYADVTKKVYECFKTGDSLVQSADRHKGSADRSAGTADEFAESGGDLAKAYRKVLTEAHAGMEGVLGKLETTMSTKWGNIWPAPPNLVQS